MYKLVVVLFMFAECTMLPSLNALTADDLFNPLPPIVNATNKGGASSGVRLGSTLSSVSYVRTNTTPFHPSSTQLFPDNSALAQKLTTFLTSIESDHYFLAFFSQIHLLLLHEIYMYLIKIYTVFNMSHIDNVKDYLTKEQTEALNKKTLIINYLIDIVEAQSNGAIRARFPALPKNIATAAGNALIQNDYGADLNLLLDESEVAVFSEPRTKQMIFDMRSTYLQILGEYLAFFKDYTNTVNEPQTINGFASYKFIQHAQRIQAIMEAASPQIQKGLSTAQTFEALKAITLINPPLFFYNNETFRALNIIPLAASSLPAGLTAIPWPAAIVKAATEGRNMTNKFGNPISKEPLAYFVDEQGNKTSSLSQAKKLFVNISATPGIGTATQSYVYRQELLPQPVWLNSGNSIIKMLKICLGDFSGLLDPDFAQEEIIDPCLRCIITNAAVKVGIHNTLDTAHCNDCESFIITVTDAIKKAKGELPQDDEDTEIVIPIQ